MAAQPPDTPNVVEPFVLTSVPPIVIASEGQAPLKCSTAPIAVPVVGGGGGPASTPLATTGPPFVRVPVTVTRSPTFSSEQGLPSNPVMDRVWTSKIPIVRSRSGQVPESFAIAPVK